MGSPLHGSSKKSFADFNSVAKKRLESRHTANLDVLEEEEKSGETTMLNI